MGRVFCVEAEIGPANNGKKTRSHNESGKFCHRNKTRD
jgi:hypothetical protein